MSIVLALCCVTFTLFVQEVTEVIWSLVITSVLLLVHWFNTQVDYTELCIVLCGQQVWTEKEWCKKDRERELLGVLGMTWDSIPCVKYVCSNYMQGWCVLCHNFLSSQFRQSQLHSGCFYLLSGADVHTWCWQWCAVLCCAVTSFLYIVNMVLLQCKLNVNRLCIGHDWCNVCVLFVSVVLLLCVCTHNSYT